ncbi:unnamed protein product, partial [Discosporangium mesarthrocarpum]
ASSSYSGVSGQGRGGNEDNEDYIPSEGRGGGFHGSKKMQGRMVDTLADIILMSGPDESLMGRCSRVLGSWSRDPGFARELARRRKVGNSMCFLMKSTDTKTQVHTSLALCNLVA